MGIGKTHIGQNDDFLLKIEGDPHYNQKVRNLFGWCSIFKKVEDNTLLVVVGNAERPRDSGRWVPIVYIQSKNENMAISYTELLHWYKLGKIVKLEPTESMSELVKNYKPDNK